MPHLPALRPWFEAEGDLALGAGRLCTAALLGNRAPGALSHAVAGAGSARPVVTTLETDLWELGRGRDAARAAFPRPLRGLEEKYRGNLVAEGRGVQLAATGLVDDVGVGDGGVDEPEEV